MDGYILVVDDEIGIRDNLQDCLETEGYTVQTATSAEEALYAAFANPPILILCDIRMGDQAAGFRVLERIRLNEPTRDTQFVFISAACEHATIRRGKNLGADDFLTKPYTRKDLLEMVSARLKRIPTPKAPKPQPYILLKSPGFPPEGQKFELVGCLIIGRKEYCYPKLTDLYTSSVGCTLVSKISAEKEGIAWLHDGAIVKTPSPETRNKHGVWVNGKRVNDQTELRGGEIVELSPVTCFEYHAPANSEEKIDVTQSSE